MKCIVKDCENHSHQGRFVGDLCSPCFQFISGDGGLYSQAYRNTQAMILQAVAAEREACEKACEAIETDRWALYKGRPPYKGTEDGRACEHVQGQSDGASACVEAIKARSAA